MFVHRVLLSATVCSACCLVGGWFTQDEPKEKETAENVEQAKEKISVLLAKVQIVQSIGEKGAGAAKLSTKGRMLVERKYDTIIQELRQKHGLDNWEPKESDQLIGMRSAAGDFLEALCEARDNVRKKAAAAANPKKKAGSPTVPAGPQFGFSPYPSGDFALTDLNKWRGDVIQQGEQFDRSLQATGEEKDIKLAWKIIQDKVIEIFDRLHPVLLADKHVETFFKDGLIQSWSRLESKEDLAVRLSGCNKVQTVFYKIVDAYGTKRKGIVAVGLYGAKSWEIAKENVSKGGFFELIKTDD